MYIEGNYLKEIDIFSPMNQLELEEKKKREKLLKKEIKNKSKKVKNKEFHINVIYLLFFKKTKRDFIKSRCFFIPQS